MKTFADLQDDISSFGPWPVRGMPKPIQRLMLRGIVARWSGVNSKHRKDSAIKEITRECRRQCSFIWSFIIGLAVRMLVDWLINQCKTNYEYQYIVKHVRKLQGEVK